MFTAIRFRDYCLPGFFQGSPHIVLAVPCHAGMTYRELREAIESEANAADYGLEDWRGFDAALFALFAGFKPSDRVDFLDHEDLERVESEEFFADETPMAYFELVESDTQCAVKAYTLDGIKPATVTFRDDKAILDTDDGAIVGLCIVPGIARRKIEDGSEVYTC